jgi:signal transduction histidine kinase
MALRNRMLRLAKATHLPRRTVRLRLMLLYGALFLISGAALLAITYFFVDAASGNAFIAHGPNGTTIAGFEIGSPPKANGVYLQHNTSGHGARATGLSIAQSAGGRPSGKNTGAGIGAVTSAEGFGSHEGLTPKQLRKQTQEFTALAYAYRDRERRQLLVESAIALGIMAVVSILLGWFVAGRVLRPLRTITAMTRDISASNLHERLALNGPDDELKELGDTIDGLLGRLDAAFRSQRQFVANASHELRTPLARQRTLAQVALADPDASADSLRVAHERVLASGEQQEQLIDAMLTLSRAQAGAVRHHRVDLAPVVRDLLAARKADAEARDLVLLPTLDPAPLRGEPRLVERLAANLIDNALRHNVRGGTVVVRTGSCAGRAWLAVSNDGPVVAPDQIERLYEPFERLGSERTHAGEGFGLGLCIVHAIAVMHGVSLTTEARPAGGLHVEARFLPEDVTPPGGAAEVGAARLAGTGPDEERGDHPMGAGRLLVH